MNEELAQLAIDHALAGRWKEAIQTNLKILKSNSKDVDALNRLARAYLETGLKTKALEIYKKALRIDKFNTIAQKGVELVKTYKVDRSAKSPIATSNTMFLEEPGITKTISLIRPGDPKIIGRLRPGESVNIVCREHNVVVVSTTNQYLGRFPDDLSSRLRTFIKAGNTYAAWLRSIEGQVIKVFIKELTRSSQYIHTPSFPLTEKLSYAAFTPPELVHEEKPDVSATEYQEEDSNSESQMNLESEAQQ